MSSPIRIRESARLIIINERDETFLFHCREKVQTDLADPELREFWITPGGGLDPGETWEQAALRELWEETGIEGIELGPWVWSRQKDGMLFGKLTRSVERYYLVRVAGVTVSNANQFDYEREVYQHHRWWPLAALRASTDIFFPEGLADLLAPLLAGEIPGTPLMLTR